MMPPAISIILPTFNRARFLPEAFDSIRCQSRTDWEVIVVDDGSTDETTEIVEGLRASVEQPVTYVRQDNQGPSAARNTGLGRAVGSYIACFDSDDLWSPDYLEQCMSAALANPDVDWVYTACRMVEMESGAVLAPSTFYVDGTPRPFLRLRTRSAGDLRILTDPATLACATTSGLYCGFQNSLIHRRVFDRHDPPIFPARVGEDVMTSIRAIARGSRLGYIDRPLVVYRVHDSNVSTPSGEGSFERRLAASETFARAFEDLAHELKDDARASRLVRRAAAGCYFWRVGYSLQWQSGRRREALDTYRKALGLWPWSLSCWKTYTLAQIRTRVGPR